MRLKKRSRARKPATTHRTPHFRAPTADLRVTFLEAMREHEEHDGRADADGIDYDELLIGDGVECYTAGRRDGSYPRPGVELMARSTELWWCEQGPDGPEYIGRVSIRHHLIPALYDQGGQIRFAVRPSRRRQGHAAPMLAAALPIAAGHGIETATLICSEGNVAAQKVIEANGGHLGQVADGRCWYRVPTSQLVHS